MPIRKEPYVVEEQPGEKYWCACGESQTQPYCDGSHERLKTGKSPVRVNFTETKRVAWCGCKQTGNPPYCDGTHSRL